MSESQYPMTALDFLSSDGELISRVSFSSKYLREGRFNVEKVAMERGKRECSAKGKQYSRVEKWEMATKNHKPTYT